MSGEWDVQLPVAEKRFYRRDGVEVEATRLSSVDSGFADWRLTLPSNLGRRAITCRVDYDTLYFLAELAVDLACERLSE